MGKEKRLIEIRAYVKKIQMLGRINDTIDAYYEHVPWLLKLVDEQHATMEQKTNRIIELLEQSLEQREMFQQLQKLMWGLEQYTCGECKVVFLVAKGSYMFDHDKSTSCPCCDGNCWPNE